MQSRVYNVNMILYVFPPEITHIVQVCFVYFWYVQHVRSW